MTISYTLDGKLYLNITNKCTCACVFCIRNAGDGVGDGENLWLNHEPGFAEVIDDLKKRNLLGYNEVVFCGYGEPTENLDTMIEVCSFLKNCFPHIKIRVNTNGLADLSHKKQVAPLLRGLVDVVSISLNAPDANRYHEITNPVFGSSSFGAMLDFARSAKETIPFVLFTAVDILTAEELSRCEKLAAGLGIPFRVRSKI